MSIEVLEKVIVPLLIAGIGGSAWLKTYLDYRKEVKAKQQLVTENDALKQEVEDMSLPLEMDLLVFNRIKGIVEEVFYATSADRFLILTATNGIRDMRFATAVYEHHKHKDKVSLSIGATNKYVRFEFDNIYKQMLKDAEIQGHIILDVDTMVDCDLKEIYRSEEIRHSIVSFILRAKIDNVNDRLFYCSIATHKKREFTRQEFVSVKIAVGKLREMFKNME